MSDLVYHHCTPYNQVKNEPIYGDPAFTSLDDDCPSWRESSVYAFRWLEERVGFYPLFLAVGATEDDIRMTGYQNQWRRVASYSKAGNEYVKPGEFKNNVLFSFRHVNGVFTDYMIWNIIYGSLINVLNFKDDPEFQKELMEEANRPFLSKLMFKKSYSRADWLRFARKNPHHVQLLAPRLDLRAADRVWVRNEWTAEVLRRRGFKNVETKRLSVKDW